MKDVWDQVQPQVSTIIVALVGILTTIVLSMLALLQKRVKLWIDSKTSLSDREIIHKIASEAYAFAEKEYKENGGPRKLNEAFSYASRMLGNAGIKVESEEIKAAIEKAVLDYKPNSKTG